MPDMNQMLPFLFGAPTAPQSQFQPWQMSTGQAYGFDPMGIFANDIGKSRQLYQLPTSTPTTPPVDPGTGGTTPPTVPGLPPGVTEEQQRLINRMFFPQGGFAGILPAARFHTRGGRYDDLMSGLPPWYANLLGDTSFAQGMRNPMHDSMMFSG